VRVLVVTPSFPTARDPVNGVFVREHALAAAEHAHVSILHLARGERWGVTRVEGEPLPTWRSGFPSRPAAAGLLASALRGLRGAPPHDLVHAHFFLGGAPVALASRRQLVISEHWSLFTRPDPRALSPVMLRVARFAFNRAAFVLPVSEALRRGIEAHGLHARFEVVPNVVDTSTFRPNGARNGRLLAVGLLVEAKGYDLLLEAVALLKQHGRPVRLDVAGDGPLRQSLVTLARRLQVEDEVRFLGILPKPEVARRMREATLFVLGSRYDNNPCAIIEALACGLPVVAPAVGGIPELVGERTGRLARPDDPASLAAEIAAAMDGLAAYDRIEIAKAAADRYGREAVGRQLAEIYRRALAETPEVA
jgi:glycosyltransferase involved in cell wall biosynthesis